MTHVLQEGKVECLGMVERDLYSFDSMLACGKTETIFCPILQ